MKVHRRTVLGGLGALFCPLCAAEANEAAPHWDYKGGGGPEHWSELSPEWKACSVGNQESPIDLADRIRADLPPLKVEWRSFPLQVVNNGHTIQVNAPPGGSVSAGSGPKYGLKQFHFHHPSEHKLDGGAFPLEAHFVHANANAAGDRLTVVGVFFKLGPANPLIGDIWANMPKTPGSKDAPSVTVDPNLLLPGNPARYHYEGSLTTPPCTENVEWHVFRDAVTASEAQFNEFASLFPNNARPVQELNRRFLLSTF